MCDRFLGEGFFLPLPLSVRRPKKPILNRINILEIILSKFRGHIQFKRDLRTVCQIAWVTFVLWVFLAGQTRGSKSWVILVSLSPGWSLLGI